MIYLTARKDGHTTNKNIEDIMKNLHQTLSLETLISMAEEEARRAPPEFIYRRYGVRFNSPI